MLVKELVMSAFLASSSSVYTMRDAEQSTQQHPPIYADITRCAVRESLDFDREQLAEGTNKEYRVPRKITSRNNTYFDKPRVFRTRRDPKFS